MLRPRSRGVQVIPSAGEGTLAPLEGWMYKKNASGGGILGGAWSKRWVHVNDERGRLHIGKKPGKEGRTIFSLSDMPTIKPLEITSKEADGHAFCFSISQAPLYTVLRCRSADERQRWLTQLQQRSEEWRERRRQEQGAQSAAVTVLSQRLRGTNAEANAEATTTGATGSDDGGLDDDTDTESVTSSVPSSSVRGWGNRMD